MAKEVEYKFIATYIPDGLPKVKLSQGYIHIDPTKQVRVRLNWDSRKAWMCIKFMDGNVRQEFETEMNFGEACELFILCKYRLTKNRYTFNYGLYTIDLDEYENGVKTVEVEVSKPPFTEEDLAQLRMRFPFIHENVDGVWEYNNYAMAGFPKSEYNPQEAASALVDAFNTESKITKVEASLVTPKIYDIYMSGFMTQGMNEPARASFIDSVKASSFKEACKKYYTNDSGKMDPLFNEENLTYWGCGLYDNYADAAKSFG